MKILTVLLATLALTACAGPVGLAYTAASTGTALTTGKTIGEHGASKLTDADCSVWNAVVDLAYICEYNRNSAYTYNRNLF